MADQVSGLLSPFLRWRRIAAVKTKLRGRVLDFGCGVGRLARYTAPDRYLGIDIDQESVETARRGFTGYEFRVIDAARTGLAHLEGCEFDTIVMLALIEHVPDPPALLNDLGRLMAPDGSMLVTTPHPAFGWVHRVGGPLGLVSREADEEHQELLGLDRMVAVAAEAGLRVVSRRRFLMGMNQLFVLAHDEMRPARAR